MPITPAQIERRRFSLGSSDAPKIILGRALEVYRQKTELDGGGVQITPGMQAGNYLEEGIIAWAADELKVRVKRNQYRKHRNGFMHANLDALIVARKFFNKWGIIEKPLAAIEAKAYNITHFGQLKNWGEPGTDEVPVEVAIQCLHQMAVANLEIVHVAALLGGRGFQLFHVKRDEKLIAWIESRLSRFWHECVVPRKPPEGDELDIEVLSLKQRDIKQVEIISEDFADECAFCQTLNEMVKRLESEHAASKARIINAMGDGDALMINGGEYMATYREHEKNYLDQKRLRAEEPEIWEEFQKTSKYRQLRIKENSNDNRIERARRRWIEKTAQLGRDETGDCRSLAATLDAGTNDQNGANRRKPQSETI